MSTDLPTEPTPAEGLLGSLQQTQADLATVAKQLKQDGSLPPSAAGTLTRLAGELAEAAAMIRAVPGAPPAAAVPVLRATAVRALLHSVAEALDCPAPATAEDEVTFLRLRSERATEALRAILNVLADPGRTDLDYSWIAANLDIAIQQYPADRYEHSAMTS